jgi:hypothetical protein
MATNFEQRTNEFIELFYEGEGKAPTYLSKQGSELRKTIKSRKPGVKKTPLQKTYAYAFLKSNVAVAMYHASSAG